MSPSLGTLLVVRTVQVTLLIMVQAAPSELSALEFVPPFPLDHIKQTLEKFRKITSSIKHIAKFQAYKTNGVVKHTKL